MRYPQAFLDIQLIFAQKMALLAKLPYTLLISITQAMDH
jgi:hypothetical protein